MTRAEVLLWQQLKARQMESCDFDRQSPIDEYIVDFFSKDLMLAIEVDGVTHNNDTGQQNDQRRQKRLEMLGVRFLRFQDEEVKQNLEGVLTVIREWIRKNTPTPNNAYSAGEENSRAKPTPAFGHPSQEGRKRRDRAAPASPPWRGAA
jgi:very-short-patch-repair endonuclease